MKRHSHRRWAAAVSAATANQRVGLAVSRLDGRGISRRTDLAPVKGLLQLAGVLRPVPGPVPRIASDLPAVSRLLVARWVRRAACRRSLTSRFSTPLAATITRIAFLWGVFAPVSRVALSLAAGPAVPAIACFARLIAFGTELRIQEPFPFPPVTSVPDDEGKYIAIKGISRENSQRRQLLIHHTSQPIEKPSVARCITRWKS